MRFKKVELSGPISLMRAGRFFDEDTVELVHLEEYVLPCGVEVFIYVGRGPDGGFKVGVINPELGWAREAFDEVSELLGEMGREFREHKRVTLPSGRVLDFSVDPPVFK